MNGKKASSAMSQSAAYSAVAESVGLTPKDVKASVEGFVTLAADQLKKTGKFNLAGMLMLKLKDRPATKARKGSNPFMKKRKAKSTSKLVKATPTKKLIKILTRMVNDESETLLHEKTEVDV